MSDDAKPENASEQASEEQKDYEEFEIGEHQVPWFLWVFFILIIAWASLAWYPFVSSGGNGY